jgi:hypothetical protein
MAQASSAMFPVGFFAMVILQFELIAQQIPDFVKPNFRFSPWRRCPIVALLRSTREKGRK